MNNDVFKLESNDQKNRAVSILLIGVGFLFIKLTAASAELDRNQRAAYLLGLLLAGLGGFFLVLNHRIYISFDAKKKQVIYQSQNLLFGKKLQFFSFREIGHVTAVRLGRWNAPSFHLILILNNGKRLTTGRWSTDENEILGLAQEIAGIIGSSSPEIQENQNGSSDVENAIIALAIGVAVYAIYYKFLVGSYCIAMWFGTAPPIIILTGFLTSFRILKRYR